MKIKDKKNKFNILMAANDNTTSANTDVAITLCLLSLLSPNTLPPPPLALITLTIDAIVID